jgi:hypothetical protein
MPAKSSKQYGFAQASLHGGIKGLMPKGMPHAVAREIVDKTPAKKRRVFAKTLANRRKKQGA